MTDWSPSSSGLLVPNSERHRFADPAVAYVAEVARQVDAFMADWTVSAQDPAPVVISTYSQQCLGPNAPATFGWGATGSFAWSTADYAMFFPFWVPAPMSVVKMAVINGTSVSGNIDLGIYDDQQNRITHAGSTAQSGTSAIQSVSVTSVTLNPGIYYMALCVDNTTSTFFGTAAADIPTCRAAGLLGQAVGAVTLPDPATFAVVAHANTPLIMVTGRSVV